MPTIQHKRGTASDLASINPLLLDGEFVIESDTNKVKCGNGVHNWNNLSYINSSGISIINGSGNFNTLTVSSVPVSVSGHTHTTSDITDFNSSVSGLLPGVSGSGYVVSLFNNNVYTISFSGVQPSGNYSVEGHTHIISEVTGLQTALDNKQPSGVYASGVHTHVSNDITDFSSSVSGLLPTISNSGDNRVLTSTGTTTGINAESDLTFDGSLLSVTGDIQANYIFGDFDGPVVYDCKNSTGSTISKGTPVYISGHFANGKVYVAPARADDQSKMPALGLLGETLVDDSEGYVYMFGALSNVDTQTPGYVVGQTLYIAPTGGLTTTRPTASNHLIQNIARVARVGDTNGRLLVLGPARTNDIPNSGNFASLTVNSTGVSVIGHTHTSSDITNFNTSVSGLLPVTNILGGSNIDVVSSGSEYTISVSGSLGLTTEEVDDRVSNLLVAGSGITLDYDDVADTLTIHNTSITPTASTLNQGSVKIVDGGGINVSPSGDISSIGSQLYLWANFR